MLDIKEIEYGELLQRCAYGEIDADGHRFYVGNYVVVFHNAWGVVCITAVCITVSDLRKCLVELAEQYDLCDDPNTYGWDVYRVVPTADDDDDETDECENDTPLRTTVLVPYTEFPYREFSACMVAGLIEDTADCQGMDLYRGDYVLLDKAESEGTAYRLAGSYSFIGDIDVLDILKRVVSGAKLLLLS